jgi:BirA family biotin operon repressor/biotin-[acetyl-CoA-carboxylase] ligase
MNLKRFRLNLIHKDTVDSTNNYAANLSKKTKQANGTVILTKRQFAGKGQRGEVWDSADAQNLTMSIIIDAKLDIQSVYYLNIVASLAVRKLLEDLKIEAKIKWPNDVLVGSKKIAGILVENQLQKSSVIQSIVGVGLNVNQENFDPLLNATSICKEKGTSFDLADIFLQLYGYFDFYIDILMQGNLNLLKKHYYNHLLWFNQNGRYATAEKEFTATNLGIDAYGRLKLQTSTGVQVFDVKEVKFIY